jgi:hypothetical protein
MNKKCFVSLTVCLLFVIAGLTGTISAKSASGKKTNAQIIQINDVKLTGKLGTTSSPVPVPRENTAQGTAKKIRQNHYLWLVLHPHGSSYWPQGHLLVNPRTKGWNQKIYVGPTGGDFGKRFDLILLQCNETAHQSFLDWQKKCAETGKYPGITIPKGGEVIDMVTLIKSTIKQ